MKVNLLRGQAMDFSFGHGDALKDGQGLFLDPIGKRAFARTSSLICEKFALLVFVLVLVLVGVAMGVSMGVKAGISS